MNEERARPALTEQLFRQFADNTQDILWMADRHLRRFDYLSPAFDTIWGRARDTIAADGALWLACIEPADRQKVRRARVRARAGERVTVDYRIRRPDGDMRWIRDGAFPILGATGVVERIGGIARDVTERQHAEQAREQALSQRDLLLRELNHRVKNNLQLVTALLHLQANRLDDATMRAHFDQASSRVAAIADIHAILHPTASSVDQVPVGDYLSSLCNRLGAAFLEETDDRVTLKVDANHAMIELDRALPLGLIVNELVTNALKHAFPTNERGEIRVSFARRDGGWRLEVRDTGCGVTAPGGRSQSGFGSGLVALLVKQIGGTLRIAEDGGTVVVVEVPA